MSLPPPSQAQVFWLLTRLRLIRLGNLVSVGISASFSKKQTGARIASHGKRRSSLLWGIVMLAVMLFANANMAYLGFRSMQEYTDGPNTLWRLSGSFSEDLLVALSVVMGLLLCLSSITALGSKELAKPEWDMEWLVTLPVKMRTLLWGRILERSVTNAVGWFAMAPMCGWMAWYSGYGWWAPIIGIVSVLPLLLIATLVQTSVEISGRVLMSPSQLRNMQAIMGVLGVTVMFLAFSLTSNQSSGFALHVIGKFPDWVTWLLPGLLVRAINAQDLSAFLLCFAGLSFQTLLLIGVSVRWMHWLLRNGIVNAGSRESGQPRSASKTSQLFKWRLKSAVQRRELTLLARDRNFMVQTLLLPMVMVAGQFVMNVGLGSVPSLFTSATTIASIAFGLAAYMLMLSAFQNLNNEGAALWLLYSFPRSMNSVLKEKAQLWAALALVYPTLIFVGGLFWVKDSMGLYLGQGALVLVGVVIYAVIAVALGVFASDPLATEPSQRIRPTYFYLFMLLSGLYGFAIAAAQWWQALIFVVLCTLLAHALWQKASDQLPFLLDPAASPPATVSTADGMMAAMMFFVLQIAIALTLKATLGKAGGTEVLMSFCGAGALTWLMVRYIYWRSKTSNIPRVFVQGSFSTWQSGVIFGAGAAVIGVTYLWLVQWLEIPVLEYGNDKFPFWLIALTVLAAPLFEEFIFRGLIFGGLRRSLGLIPSAVGSAAIFAVMHPPISIVPVFALGICTAVAFERSKVLITPMLVHAIYNAAGLSFQWR